MRRGTLAALILLFVTGCSQAAALAPVGGNHLTTVRFAANDVLVNKGIELMTAPVCTAPDDNVSCQGTTLQGEPIIVTSTAAAPLDIRVTVAGRVLYQGPIQDILDAEARPKS